MVVERGEVWWADLPSPVGSGPGYPRPVIIVQSDAFNRSRIQTVLGMALTSNLALLEAPGNVLIPAKEAGLPRDSIANVSQVLTIDRELLTERVGRLRGSILDSVDAGLRLVLDL